LPLILFTALTLIAFAANSLINRGALIHELIGPGEFATLRVIFGGMTLFFLLVWRNKHIPKPQPIQIKGAVGLATYMIGFSYAYMSLNAGLGALILFGTVQVVMFVAAAFSGERLSIHRWFGSIVALVGLFVLFWPDKNINLPLDSLGLMLLAGWGWAVYSLEGRKVIDPLLTTTWNFIYVFPVTLLVLLITVDGLVVTVHGVFLAFISGAVMSGLGYVLWYWVLPQLDVTIGALSQLLVPVIALVLGSIFLQEIITQRATIAAILIVGGVAVGSAYKRQ
jgi:drug/metabolite transporter (DMT)-like permease|tara:strand:- start:145 stop:984 length:840 start_codon:yes stop_codon:yes gene_type:complete